MMLRASVPPTAGLRKAPGPRGFLPQLTVPTFSGPAPHERLARDANRYGDVVRYTAGPFVIHALRDPDHVKHVLQENAANYVKGRGIQKLRAFLGNGLLTSEGDFWKRQRRLAQPAFHHRRLARLASIMARCGEDLVARFEDHARRAPGEPIELHDEMMRVTLRIVGLGLFGAETEHDAGAVGRALGVALEHTNVRLRTLIPLPLAVPTPQNLEFRRALRTLDELVYGMIARRRAAPAEDRADLLAMLMQARDEETGEAMSDRQLRDEVMTLVLAGHETTANALTWTFWLLSRHPDAARALAKEVDEVLGGRSPSFEDLPKLTFTRMVLEESMRLYPPAWAFGRRALADDRVGPYHVPKGSFVAVSTYVLHRNPAWWPNPEGFEPERFRPGAPPRHKFAYLPFGGGPRVCIGNQFAMMEAQILLAQLAARFRLDLAPGHRVEPQPMITMRPKYGMRMILRPA